MVRLGPVFRDQLLAHANRKRQVGEMIPVQVSELATAEAKLDSAEAMRHDAHAFPAGDFARDLCCDRIVHGSHPACTSRTVRVVPPRRDHHLVTRLDVLSLHVVADRPRIPALSDPAGAPMLRIPT
jgi:hypothetical protein